MRFLKPKWVLHFITNFKIDFDLIMNRTFSSILALLILLAWKQILTPVALA
jgi:hypothetical protein